LLTRKPLFSAMPKKKDPASRQRYDLGPRWSKEERDEIDLVAAQKGVLPTTVIRLAVKEFIDGHKKRRRSEGLE
jgi:hypothetical protein